MTTWKLSFYAFFLIKTYCLYIKQISFKMISLLIFPNFHVLKLYLLHKYILNTLLILNSCIKYAWYREVLDFNSKYQIFYHILQSYFPSMECNLHTLFLCLKLHIYSSLLNGKLNSHLIGEFVPTWLYMTIHLIPNGHLRWDIWLIPQKLD